MDRGPELSRPVLGWPRETAAVFLTCYITSGNWVSPGLTFTQILIISHGSLWGVSEAPRWVVTARGHLQGQEEPAKQQG